ncbi:MULTISPECIES: hypothetical protein [unclassified Streptomyces]
MPTRPALGQHRRHSISPPPHNAKARSLSITDLSAPSALKGKDGFADYS